VVERSPEKAGVGGSTPSLATIIPATLTQFQRLPYPKNPKSSRTKPPFRRREGSRAKSPTVRGDPRKIPFGFAQGPALCPLENPRGLRDVAVEEKSERPTPKIRSHPERSRFSGGERDLARSPRISVVIRARSPSASLRAGSRPAGKNAGPRDDAAEVESERPSSRKI